MNRTKIEWCSHTWNPVTGCEHGCPYCYARPIQRRFGKTKKARAFKYEFHPDRMKDPEQLRKPARIFVVNMGDLFGEWVPSRVIARVVKAALDTPRHIYFFLTKNPIRMGEWLKQNRLIRTPLWFGTTVTNQQEFDGRVGYLLACDIRRTFVSMEPMLEPIRLGDLKPNWVIVGEQTGPGAKPMPEEWLFNLATDCGRKVVPMFVKNNAPWGKDWGKRPQLCPGGDNNMAEFMVSRPVLGTLKPKED